MPQFFIDPHQMDEKVGRAILGEEETRHLVKILRVALGSQVALFDGTGSRWVGVLEGLRGGRACVSGLLPVSDNEPSWILELIQGLPKGDRWEWVIEKGTELGVSRFRPVYTEHGVAHLPAARLPARVDRWRKIALGAAKQSERGFVPEVCPPVPLPQFVASLSPRAPGELRLALVERDRRALSLPLVPPGERVLLAVGPEGGWSEADRRQLRSAGFQGWSLGPRILRTETAALAGAAILLHGH